MNLYNNVYYGIFSYFILSTFYVWWLGSLRKYNDTAIPFLECLKKGWRYAPILCFNEIYIAILNLLLK